ncbi:hypothetical protein WMY93_005445 [Mugilogobius chulae]|uniref:Uncharacterized protein n=1 Tax=Mugilogobius chulae TaxID=88201 RepID=A0AAW0PHX2_9GOBI
MSGAFSRNLSCIYQHQLNLRLILSHVSHGCQGASQPHVGAKLAADQPNLSRVSRIQPHLSRISRISAHLSILSRMSGHLSRIFSRISQRISAHQPISGHSAASQPHLSRNPISAANQPHLSRILPHLIISILRHLSRIQPQSRRHRTAASAHLSRISGSAISADLSRISAASESQPHLADLSRICRISAASQPHLSRISAASQPHQPHLSRISAGCPGASQPILAQSQAIIS